MMRKGDRTPPTVPRQWFRRLLALLPFDTRRELGREMERTFLDEYRDEATDPRARRRLWTRTLGGVLAFARREQWAATRDDLRHAARGWRRSPGLFALLVGSMCIGIGGVTVAFAIVDGVILRPLPVADPASLMRIGELHDPAFHVTYATYLDLEQRGAGTITSIGASRFWFASLTGEGPPERLTCALVSGGFFGTLGARPIAGRLLDAGDDVPGRDDVVVISSELWQRRFGGDRAAIGKVIQLNDTAVTIVGVIPSRATWPLGTDVWAPLTASEGQLAKNRSSHLLRVIARRAPGVSTATLNADLAARAAAIGSDAPGADPDLSLHAEPLLARTVASVRATLLTTLGATVLLLIVLGTNVAHVQMARAAGREGEIAVRTALGASRGRVVRLLLTETIALAVIAGAAGLTAAWAVVHVLRGVLPAILPRADLVGIDWRAASLGLGVASLTGVVFGMWPAWRAARTHRLRSRRGVGNASIPGRLLGTAQLAVTFALVVVAGLVIRSAIEVGRVPLGFDPEGLVRVDFSLSPGRVPDPSDGDAFVPVLDPLMRRLETLPGVTATGLTTTAPFAGGASTSFVLVGEPALEDSEPTADIRIVDPGYFHALGAPLRSGRGFAFQDGAQSPPVMVISETLARRHFGYRNPIGRSITMLHWGPPLTAEVIGVVGDVTGADLEADPMPTIYWHYPQFPQLFSVSLVIRTSGDANALIPTIRDAIWELEPNLALPQIAPMTSVVGSARAQRTILTWLLAGLAGAAIVFALVGLYGLLAHKATRERPANGVRAALGARPVDIASLVGREAATLASFGLAAGALLALAGGRVVASLLYGTGATDVPAFTAAALLVLAAAAAASLGPAWRAARVDPAIVLRRD